MRILVIEDDPVLRASLVATLREENYAVDCAATGDEGLFKAKDNAYDALLLDLMLPGIDGWEVIARLRPEVRTPILMVTARDTIRDRVKGLNSGADDYLVKPFDIEELLARVRALIRRNAGQTHPFIQVDSVAVDTALRRVSVAGVEISLTATEYSLLEYLILNRGTVVTRTTLYGHLFDEDDNTLSNSLDVHVSNLRKKLGCDIITTRRGHGYCIQ